jgi:hypothetical protein
MWLAHGWAAGQPDTLLECLPGVLAAVEAAGREVRGVLAVLARALGSADVKYPLNGQAVIATLKKYELL